MSETNGSGIHAGVRLAGGGLLLAGVLFSSTGSQGGVVALIVLVLVAVGWNGVRSARMAALLFAGGMMYVPVLFLAPFPVALKGFSSAIVVLATVSRMTDRGFHEVVARLPLPVFPRFLTLQILHQAQVLQRETLRVHHALAVRGGTQGLRGTWRFARAIPESWMPRIIFRADRVARAMDVRGYGLALAPLTRPSLSAGECVYLVLIFCLALAACTLSRSALL